MSCVTAPSPGSIETIENHGLSQTSPTAPGAEEAGAKLSSSSVESASHIAAPNSVCNSATLDHSNISIEGHSQLQAIAPGLSGVGVLESVTGMTSPAPGSLESIGGFSGQSQLPTAPGLDLANSTSIPNIFSILQSSMMPAQPPPPVSMHPHVMPPPSFAHISPQPIVPGYGDVALLNSAGFHSGGLQTIGQYAVPPTLHPGTAQLYGMGFGHFAQSVASTGVSVASDERPVTSSSGSGSICKHFLAGRCNYGTSCKFSHATDAPGAGVSPLGIYNGPGSLICKHWLSGRCTYPDCKFKHEGTPGTGFAVPALAPAVAPTFGYSALTPSLGTIRSSPY